MSRSQSFIDLTAPPLVAPAREPVKKIADWLDRHRASFETAASRPPQDERFS
jgi:hypothetical protein